MSMAFPPLDPEYDAFLYAIICSEKNGMQLTMASAIARSGCDPWKEAARISKMPKDMALQVLALLMPDQPAAGEKATNGQITIDRLFALLPKPKPVLAIGKREAIQAVRGNRVSVIFILAFCTALIFAQILIKTSHHNVEGQTGAPAAAASTETVPAESAPAETAQ
jgi:hypothetical protein